MWVIKCHHTKSMFCNSADFSILIRFDLKWYSLTAGCIFNSMLVAEPVCILVSNLLHAIISFFYVIQLNNLFSINMTNSLVLITQISIFLLESTDSLFSVVIDLYTSFNSVWMPKDNTVIPSWYHCLWKNNNEVNNVTMDCKGALIWCKKQKSHFFFFD